MSEAIYRSLAVTPSDTAATAPEPYYPSVSFTRESFPELYSLSVGDSVELKVICKVVSKEESENYSCIRVELKKAGIEEIKTEKTISPEVVVKVKNDADVAIEALTSLTRTL